MKIEIEIDPEVVEHLKGETCGAGKYQPCFFSEIIMRRIVDAVRHERPQIGASSDAKNQN